MSIRAIEFEVSAQVWRWHLTVSVLPLVWNKWLWASTKWCWSQGSLFHLFLGPLHIWCADYGTVRLFQIGADIHRNGFWWDKPVRLAVPRPAPQETKP